MAALGSRKSVRSWRWRSQQLAASGVRYVRWFLFCDGRAGIRFSPAGRPLGLDDLRVQRRRRGARRRGPARHQIMFVLLDFLWCDPASAATRGVQMGGRAHVLADAGKRDALLDLVLAPAARAIRRGAARFSRGTSSTSRNGSRPSMPASFTRFSATASRLIHSATSHPVTVGSAGVRWRDRYAALGLDFYQVHWYDELEAPAVAGDAGLRARLRSACAAGRVSDARIEAHARRTSSQHAPRVCGAFYGRIARTRVYSVAGLGVEQDELFGRRYPISSSAFTPVRMP